MDTLFRISVFCPDRVGLIASITGKLFDLGANLGATRFAVLGSGAEFTTVCSAADSITDTDLHDQLQSLPELEDADIRVSPFKLEAVHGPGANITHRILVEGGDNPGLVARLTEVFIEFNANIVRLNTELIPADGRDLYRIDIQVNIPPSVSQPCLATIENTANTLQMGCHIENQSDFQT